MLVNLPLIVDQIYDRWHAQSARAIIGDEIISARLESVRNLFLTITMLSLSLHVGWKQRGKEVTSERGNSGVGGESADGAVEKAC